VALAAPALEDAAVTQRIVVRAPNWLGDVLLSLGAVRDLRRNFPEARLDVLVKPGLAALYAAVPEVDGTLEAHGAGRDVRAVRAGRYDLAVLLTNSFGTAWVAWRAGVPERWGYARDGRSLLLTRAVPVPEQVRGTSQVFYYRALLGGAGLRVAANPETTLACPDDWRARGREVLGDGRWIAVSPGAAFGTAKRWLPDRFAEAATAVARERGARVVIVGAASERAVGEQVRAALGVEGRLLAGETTLPELVGVLANADLLLTNDSGPMHLASALDVPLVAIFGPTDARETSPVRGRVVSEPVPCAPCMLRECPIDHRCMRGVDVARVVAAATESRPPG
jgi:heptosyltransferase II